MCAHINGHVSIVGISIFAYRSHLFPGTLEWRDSKWKKQQQQRNTECENKATTNHSIAHNPYEWKEKHTKESEEYDWRD